MSDDIAAIAAELAGHFNGGTPIPSLRGRVEDLETAYKVQEALRAQIGPFCERKIALNSPVMQQMFGIDTSVCAVVTGTAPLANGATLSLADFQYLALEPELLAVVGRDVSGPVTADDVDDVISHFSPGFELVDFRTPNRDTHAPTAVACNVTNAGCVIGDARMRAADLAGGYTLTYTVNGEVLAQTDTPTNMPPAESVAFILNHFTARAEVVRKGEVLLCGTHHPPLVITAPGTASFVVNGNEVSLSISA